MPKTWSRILKILSISLFSILVVLLVLVNVLAKNLIQEESDMQAALNASGQKLPIHINTMEIDTLGTIRYARIGADTLPLLILIHGSPGDLNAFDSWFADTLLTQKYQLLAYDRPGFGMSQLNMQSALEVQSLCVSTIMNSIEAPSYYLLGHSYGGAVVLASMLEEEEHIAHSIIVAGSVDPALEPREWWRPIISSKLVSWTLPRMLNSSNQEIEYLYEELLLMEKRLVSGVSSPLTVFQGKADKLVPAGNADYLKTKIPNCETVWFEEEGHFILWTKQDVIVDHLMKLEKGLNYE